MNILAQCDSRGIRLAIDGGSLKVDAPKGALSPDVLALLKEHKADLLAMLQAEDLREHFEERAGILEYDAGLPRPDAEFEAARITATYARNRSYQWASLRLAFKAYNTLLAALPDTIGVVDSLPLGAAKVAVLGGRVVRQGVFAGAQTISSTNRNGAPVGDTQ